MPLPDNFVEESKNAIRPVPSHLQRSITPKADAGPASSVLLRRALRAAVSAEADLNMNYGLQVVVDEVAIVWRSEEELYAFVNDIHRDHGWHVFNTVEDSGPIVSSDPHDSRGAYRAKYVFVSHPSTNVRLELMQVIGGASDVHAPLLERDSHAIVHASWKAPSLEAYRSQVRRLVDAKITCAKGLNSSYGNFSYWGAFAPYLKPRVNLRDSV